MKHYLFLLTILAVVSCSKKNDAPASPSGKPFISELYESGKLRTRFEYGSENELIAYNQFNGPGGAQSGRIELEYDDEGHLSMVTQFSMPAKAAVTRVAITTDDEGNMTRSDHYELTGPTPNEVANYTQYVYNDKGLMIQMTSRDGDDKFLSRTNYAYYDGGTLKESRRYLEDAGVLWMKARSVYSDPLSFKAVGVGQLVTLLGPEGIAGFASESIQSYQYSKIGSITAHSSLAMSGRELNDDGSIKRQVQTYQGIVPAIAPTETPLSYEYVNR